MPLSLCSWRKELSEAASVLHSATLLQASAYHMHLLPAQHQSLQLQRSANLPDVFLQQVAHKPLIATGVCSLSACMDILQSQSAASILTQIHAPI